MALRFRKSFKLAPGVRINLSGSGASWSFGPRGSSVSMGKRGTYLNSGIPDTGFSFRTKLVGSSAPKRNRAALPTVQVSMTAGVNDEGTLYFRDGNGNDMPEHIVELAKRQNGDAIRALIQAKCDEINGQIDALGQIHLNTPSCKQMPRFTIEPFEELQPIPPALKPLNILTRLFKSKRETLNRHNAALTDGYSAQLAKWRQRNLEFEAAQLARKKFIQQDILTDITAMEQFLEENLQDIAWPRETNVCFEITSGGQRVLLDVDLPEIEHFPTKIAAVPMRGFKLSVKDMPETKVRKLYMEHVHGIGFRITGEAFAALPVAEEVVLSTYSQRPDPRTGSLRDDYLYSVCVKRHDWEEIHFGRLQAINVVEAFARYDLRRSMSKTGVFKPIEPFSS